MQILFDLLYDFIVKFHIYLQLLLISLVLWIVFKKSDKKVKGLTKEEEEEIIRNYQPKPLVNAYIKPKFERTRIVDKKIDKYIYVNGQKCLNFASYNFLGLLTNDISESKAIEAVKKYGIGSCGPRGFYGTVDVHLQMEEAIAKFLGVEEAIVYSYGFSAVASAIPAYAKRSDIIFVDENVNFAIQKGLDASRSEIKYFKHNNTEHLHELLCQQEVIDLKNPRKSMKTRKFLIIEGIYAKTGDLCKLPELMKLKKKFKLRLFIDDSVSFGVLGKNGRGIVEHYGLSFEDVDLVMVSMEYSLASIGGFCASSEFIVEHQRLSGLGYCFSASLPPLLTVAAMTNLKLIEENPIFLQELNNLCYIMHKSLQHSDLIMKYFRINGEQNSPIKFLVPTLDNNKIEEFLEDFVVFCEQNGVAVCKTEFLPEDKPPCLSSIRITVCRNLTEQHIEKAIFVLEDALKSIDLKSPYLV